MNKYLIVRFSSFGDIAQAMPCAVIIRQQDPDADIHWLTRKDFYDFVKSLPCIDRVWGLERLHGIKGLISLISDLKKENYTHIYDAHSNLRSFIVCSVLRLNFLKVNIIRRSKNRLRRLLLFWFRKNYFPSPFRGAISYKNPLKKWFSKIDFPPPIELAVETAPLSLPQDFILSSAIVIAPSATWELKRWPLEYWSQLVSSSPGYNFILLAGKDDVECDKIAEDNKKNVLNLRGKLSWVQSAKIISLAKTIISGDTGVMHLADIMGKNTIALIGPTAFGHPTRATSKVIETKVYCRPCTKDGRGRCINAKYKKCLRDISPQMVTNQLKAMQK
ncbi:MAG: hypothetical protein A2Z20_10640 [Bdellovibrionales bacterium RBG_16_40_8]|nr:MAG: hypothetical protein A2Z20_10640 [Bdellovibrionales bacterium RBG_16_40_8]